MRKPCFLLIVFLWIAIASMAVAQNTLTIDRPSDPSSLDPHFELTAPGSWVYGQVLETLVTLNPQMELEPRLATHWEFIEPTRLRLYLRQDVDFHDGTPFNADAVKFTWDRALEGDPPARWLAFIGLITGVEVFDEFTIDIVTSSPYGPLLYTLTPPYMAVLSPAAVQEQGDAFGRNPVGTGPFKFVEWRSNERIVLEANDDYWRGRPELDRLVFRTIPEEGSRMLALRTGETDMVLLPAPTDLESLSASSDFWVAGTPGVGVFSLQFNLEMPFVDDIRVRRAIAHAIDRELIVEAVLEGGGVTASSVIGEPIFGYKDMRLDELYPYDPDRAIQLLEEAGYVRRSDGFMYDSQGQLLSLDFLPSNGRALKDREIAEVLQEFLRQIGIAVKIDLYEWATTSTMFREQHLPYHLTTSAFYTANADADFALMTNFESSALPPTGWNRSHYANAEIDTWLADAQVSLDGSERSEFYNAVQDQLAYDLPVIPLYGTYEVAALSSRVAGFVAHPVNYLLDIYPVHVVE